MSSLSFVGVVALALVVAVQAHLCVVHPPQRGGSAGIFTPGAPICGLTSAPCGGQPVSTNPFIVKPGSQTVITVIKNVDHYFAANPGNFSFYGFSSGGRSPLLALLPDTQTGNLFEFNVTLPTPAGVLPGDYFLQVAYFTNNPRAAPVYYTCVDSRVVG